MSACSDNNENSNLTAPGNNEITDEETQAVAEDYGSALAGEDEGMLSLWTQMSGDGGPQGARPEGESRGLDDTLAFTHNGFQVVLIRNFFDADGNWYPSYDPLTSVRMERILTINGTHTNQSGRRTVTLAHSDDMMIWGIAPTETVYRLEGDGDRSVESEFSSRFGQNVKTVSAEYHWSVNDLLISHDWMVHPFPLDGTIAVNVTVTRTHVNPGRDFEQTRHAEFIVYFNGTQYAELVFANGAHFWIDLTNGWCHNERP
jgi:hypothetical protein